MKFFRPRDDGPGVPSQILRAGCGTLGVLLVLFVLIFYVPEAMYWRQQGPWIRVYSAMVEMSHSLEDFNEQHGYYPRTESELLTLGQPGQPLVHYVQDAARRAGHSVDKIVFGRASAPGPPVLILYGREGRLEFYAGGQVGMSRCFRSPGEHKPNPKLKILD